MIDIPSYLNIKPINDYIDQLISFDGATDFYSLDDLQQDQLISLGIKAAGGDNEIILSQEANCLLAKYLQTYDRDDEIEFMRAAKESAREHFAEWFNEMIDERVQERDIERKYEMGLRRHQDQINGEITWVR